MAKQPAKMETKASRDRVSTLGRHVPAPPIGPALAHEKDDLARQKRDRKRVRDT